MILMGSPTSSKLLLPCPTTIRFLHPPFLSSAQLLLPLYPQIPTCNPNTHPMMSSISTVARRNTSFFSGSPNFRRRSLMVRFQLNFKSPLISPDDHWGIWTALFAIGACGRWSEKTKIGIMVSTPLVSILVGQAASNLGILPCEAPAYSIVLGFLLPLTIPLLLFKADLRQVVQSTGSLLLAFLLGSVATMIGTLVAYLMVPMRSLGVDGWKVAAALMGTYIGGFFLREDSCLRLQYIIPGDNGLLHFGCGPFVGKTGLIFFR